MCSLSVSMKWAYTPLGKVNIVKKNPEKHVNYIFNDWPCIDQDLEHYVVSLDHNVLMQYMFYSGDNFNNLSNKYLSLTNNYGIEKIWSWHLYRFIGLCHFP